MGLNFDLFIDLENLKEYKVEMLNAEGGTKFNMTRRGLPYTYLRMRLIKFYL